MVKAGLTQETLMKIQEYIAHLSEWGSDARERHLRPLLDVLSAVSMKTLHEHQQELLNSSAEAGYEGFVASQNEVILQCLHLEVSDMGAVVRRTCGLDPLTLDTDVPTDRVEAELAKQSPNLSALEEAMDAEDNQDVPATDSDAVARETDAMGETR